MHYNGLYNMMNQTLEQYQSKFQNKIQPTSNPQPDLLMDCFNLSHSKKLENMQYWNRELGHCWQKLINQIFHEHQGYQTALKIGRDEPCDLIVDSYAIDTKYRIGSGDSGTIKKIKRYGDILKELHLEPVLLILREDNLRGPINGLKNWSIFTGKETFEFIQKHSGFNLKEYLVENRGRFTL